MLVIRGANLCFLRQTHKEKINSQLANDHRLVSFACHIFREYDIAYLKSANFAIADGRFNLPRENWN